MRKVIDILCSRRELHSWVLHNLNVQFCLAMFLTGSSCDKKGLRLNSCQSAHSCYHEVTNPGRRVLLEKLISELFKKYHNFTEPEGSLPWSQEPARAKWIQFTVSHLIYPISSRFMLILSSLLCLGLPSSLLQLPPPPPSPPTAGRIILQLVIFIVNFLLATK
jgi:hypothetical protein